MEKYTKDYYKEESEKMKFFKRGIAVLLAVLLMMPKLPVIADEMNPTVDSIETVESTAPVEPTDPVESTAPVEPTDPVEPTAPVEPEDGQAGEGIEGGIAPFSLLPLDEVELSVDLSGWTPVELTMVPIETILGSNVLGNDAQIAWRMEGYDFYTDAYHVSTEGVLDLSRYTWATTASDYEVDIEFITDNADQLDMENTRYFVSVTNTGAKKWLIPTVYAQDGYAGTREQAGLTDYYYYDYSADNRTLYITASLANKVYTDTYVSLNINPEVFANPNFSQVKAYEGNFTTAEDAMASTDITAQLFATDMTQANAGFCVDRYTDTWVTLVSLDSSGNVTGCLPFRIYLSTASTGFGHYFAMKNDDGSFSNLNYNRGTYSYENGIPKWTYTLYQGVSSSQTMYVYFPYYVDGVIDTTALTAAYAGNYTSISEAVAAGAVDIKDSLFDPNVRYGADFSQGVYFSIFVGEDETENQAVYRFWYKLEEGTIVAPAYNHVHSGTAIYFNGLMDSSGNTIPCYCVEYDEDSYGEYNYRTILVGADVDLTNLAPVFSTSTGVNLYAVGSSTPEVSGVSCHNFADGAVQYTASAQNGEDSVNYWLQIIKPTDGQLYINSLADAESHVRVENGVTYATREVMLDSFHDDMHDILLLNMGTAAIPNLGVELVSDTVALDDYWTLTGEKDFMPFNGVSTDKAYGKLQNMAKIRLVKKEGAADGTAISGTLTIKSGTTPLMVFTLTGTVGDPTITTSEVPNAVKYVPYGTMIQNSNKYSWNKISYDLSNGQLPAGMELRQNGELYGIPTETGEFEFTVELINGNSSFGNATKKFTLTVLENTDANVNAATDEGYTVTERVPNITVDNLAAAYLMVSQGALEEFTGIYLDGQKLAEGTEYTKESGSTRVTIQAQTLVRAGSGSHTLGMEFRTADAQNSLRRAAQNYVVGDVDVSDVPTEDTGNTEASTGSSGSVLDSSSVADSTDSYVSSITTIENIVKIEYTVVSGDSLWKIAKKFYGNGNFWQKIYQDNASTISDPNIIRVGQKILIYLTESGEMPQTTQKITVGGTYIVQTGDSLWKIADKVYGKGRKWTTIYNANINVLSDPSKIRAGQVLVIPED